MIDSHPDLEVGGGLPIWVSAVNITLGTMVFIASIASLIEMRAHPNPR